VPGGDSSAANPLATARYIGSGEAASYRRLPPSEPRGPYMARTPARPVRAVKEWPAMIAGHSAFWASGRLAGCAGTLCFGQAAGCAAALFSSQVGLAGIGDARVGQHVHERRLAGGEGPFQGRPQLVRALHQLAVAAERLHHLVVAAARPKLGRDRIAVEELHRMLLECPDA